MTTNSVTVDIGRIQRVNLNATLENGPEAAAAASASASDDDDDDDYDTPSLPSTKPRRYFNTDVFGIASWLSGRSEDDGDDALYGNARDDSDTTSSLSSDDDDDNKSPQSAVYYGVCHKRQEGVFVSLERVTEDDDDYDALCSTLMAADSLVTRVPANAARRNGHHHHAANNEIMYMGRDVFADEEGEYAEAYQQMCMLRKSEVTREIGASGVVKRGTVTSESAYKSPPVSETEAAARRRIRYREVPSDVYWTVVQQRAYVAALLGDMRRRAEQQSNPVMALESLNNELRALELRYTLDE